MLALSTSIMQVSAPDMQGQVAVKQLEAAERTKTDLGKVVDEMKAFVQATVAEKGAVRALIDKVGKLQGESAKWVKRFEEIYEDAKI